MKNNPVLKWAIIGCIYALMPVLGVVSWGNKGGDPGPLWVFMVPLFWPAYATLLALLIPISLFFKFTSLSFSEMGVSLLLGSINVLLWIIIGAFIGWIIKRRKGGKKNEK